MNKFTESEIDYLINNYCCENKEDILVNLSTHTWSSIMSKAKSLNIKRAKYRSSKLKKLLDNNIINAYWWGFIMSDGHLSPKTELVVQLSRKDEHHLNKLSVYLGKKYIVLSNNMVRLSVMDHINGEKLRQKLDLQHNKTYVPPANFDFLQSDDEKLAFLIGFIDGDGYIHHTHDNIRSIKVEIHPNWKSVFDAFIDDISRLLIIKSKITNRGFYCFNIYNQSQFNKLTEFIVTNKIPALERKWFHETNC